jgi:GT2 family glycosyltransferase
MNCKSRPHGNIHQVLWEGNFIPAMTTLVKRECYHKVGMYDETLFYEDWDMWLRLSHLGDIIFVNRVVCDYRLHETNMTRNRNLIRDKVLDVRKKMYHSADLDEDEKRLILLGYRYYELYRARIIFLRAARKLSRGRWLGAFKQLPVIMGHILAAIKGDL